MNSNSAEQQIKSQQDIIANIKRLFAPEDDGLRQALTTAREANLPAIHISPIQGKFLQLLATLCNAKKILEIGSLVGPRPLSRWLSDLLGN